MQIEEAIEILRKDILIDDCFINHELDVIFKESTKIAIDTVLNELDTIHHELKIAVKQIKDFEKGIDRLKKQKEEKDKVIDEMALSMWRNDWISGIPNNLKAGIECIKEYFYKKAQK